MNAEPFDRVLDAAAPLPEPSEICEETAQQSVAAWIRDCLPPAVRAEPFPMFLPLGDGRIVTVADNRLSAALHSDRVKSVHRPRVFIVIRRWAEEANEFGVGERTKDKELADLMQQANATVKRQGAAERAHWLHWKSRRRWQDDRLPPAYVEAFRRDALPLYELPPTPTTARFILGGIHGFCDVEEVPDRPKRGVLVTSIGLLTRPGTSRKPSDPCDESRPFQRTRGVPLIETVHQYGCTDEWQQTQGMGIAARFGKEHAGLIAALTFHRRGLCVNGEPPPIPRRVNGEQRGGGGRTVDAKVKEKRQKYSDGKIEKDVLVEYEVSRDCEAIGIRTLKNKQNGELYAADPSDTDKLADIRKRVVDRIRKLPAPKSSSEKQK